MISLTVPTNRTSVGPQISMEKNVLLVSYDFIDDAGKSIIGKVSFEDILAYQYWDNSICPAENILGPTEIRLLDQSNYLDNAKARWNQTVGWQEWQHKLGGNHRFRHFTMYFDDGGSLDIVAASCEVDSAR